MTKLFSENSKNLILAILLITTVFQIIIILIKKLYDILLIQVMENNQNWMYILKLFILFRCYQLK